MKFTVIVHSSPLSHQGSASALNFCKAVLNAGHSITSVFFYDQGVINADIGASPHTNDLSQKWAALSQYQPLDLVICSASAAQYGVFNSVQANRQQLKSNLASGFEISGLGQMMAACLKSDRTVTFH